MENKLELLEQEVQTLQLTKDVMVEENQLQHQVHNLKTELRDLNGLYDTESFRVDIKNVLKAVGTAIVLTCSLLLDVLDKFLNYCDNFNKGDLK